MNVRVNTLAGNIIREELPVNLFSMSAQIDDETAASLQWDDRDTAFVTAEKHPELCRDLCAAAEQQGWRVGVWPGSLMPITFTLHQQPDDWGGHQDFATGI